MVLVVSEAEWGHGPQPEGGLAEDAHLEVTSQRVGGATQRACRRQGPDRGGAAVLGAEWGDQGGWHHEGGGKKGRRRQGVSAGTRVCIVMDLTLGSWPQPPRVGTSCPSGQSGGAGGLWGDSVFESV